MSYNLAINSNLAIPGISPLVRKYILFEGTSRSTYSKVTQHALWAHTIGRISNAVRIPLLLVSLAFQITLLPIRFVVSLIAEGVGRRVHRDEWDTSKHFHNLWMLGMNFAGVCDSIINIARTIDRTCAAAVNVLYAPPKEYPSFGVELVKILDVGGALIGNHQGNAAESYIARVRKEGPTVLRSLVKINESCWESDKDRNMRQVDDKVKAKTLTLKMELENTITRLENLAQGKKTPDEEQLRKGALAELKLKLIEAETLNNKVTALKVFMDTKTLQECKTLEDAVNVLRTKLSGDSLKLQKQKMTA